MDTSDYRGSVSEPILEANTSQSGSMPKNQPYVPPTKEQAIVLNSLDSLTLTDYLVAVGDIVEPRNILFASRMSNKRVCMYLASTEHVDKIVNNFTNIMIQGEEVSVRRLVTPSRRLLLSNVCPQLPQEFLERILRDMKLRLVSPITFLRAGSTRQEFGHVLSFRRQVYIQVDTEISLPSSVVVKYQDTNYRIFMNFDNMVCYRCKKPGHLARGCNENQVTDQNLPQDISPASPEDEAEKGTPNVSNKRSAPSTESGVAEQVEHQADEAAEGPSGENSGEKISSDAEFQVPKRGNRSVKKLKRSESQDSQTPLEEVMLPTKSFFETNPKPSLTMDQVTDFISNVVNHPDPLSLARTYTENVEDLLKILTDLYPFLTHRGTKSRITRAKKRIKRLLEDELDVSDMDTDATQSSY